LYSYKIHTIKFNFPQTLLTLHKAKDSTIIRPNISTGARTGVSKSTPVGSLYKILFQSTKKKKYSLFYMNA